MQRPRKALRTGAAKELLVATLQLLKYCKVTYSKILRTWIMSFCKRSLGGLVSQQFSAWLGRERFSSETFPHRRPPWGLVFLSQPQAALIWVSKKGRTLWVTRSRFTQKLGSKGTGGEEQEVAYQGIQKFMILHKQEKVSG